MRRLLFLFLFLFSFLLLTSPTAGAAAKFDGDYSKLSGIIIPGFASTQLRSWSILDCPYSPLDFNPLDLVWLDTTKVRTSSLLAAISSLSLSLFPLNLRFVCLFLEL